MRITESQLRRIIRQEVGRLTEMPRRRAAASDDYEAPEKPMRMSPTALSVANFYTMDTTIGGRPAEDVMRELAPTFKVSPPLPVSNPEGRSAVIGRTRDLRSFDAALEKKTKDGDDFGYVESVTPLDEYISALSDKEYEMFAAAAKAMGARKLPPARPADEAQFVLPSPPGEKNYPFQLMSTAMDLASQVDVNYRDGVFSGSREDVEEMVRELGEYFEQLRKYDKRFEKYDKVNFKKLIKYL